MFDCYCQYTSIGPCAKCRMLITDYLDATDVSQIKVYTDIQAMTGSGEEWLVDAKENVRAVFINGDLKCQVLYLNNNEKTKVA